MYLKCNTFALCGACYEYRLDEGSITRSVSLKSFDALPTMNRVLELCQKESMPVDIEINVYNEYWATLLRLKSKVKLLPCDVQDKAKAIIEEYSKVLLSKVSFSKLLRGSKRTLIKFLIAKIVSACQ